MTLAFQHPALAPPDEHDFGHRRVILACLPTPFEPLDTLAHTLGVPARRLLVKRDDLTGLAMGGNKVRKLEYLCADALARWRPSPGHRRASAEQPLPADGCCRHETWPWLHGPARRAGTGHFQRQPGARRAVRGNDPLDQRGPDCRRLPRTPQ